MRAERALYAVLAFVALSIFVSPWTRELFVGDETKYAQVVREMRAGAFFLPTLEGTPFTHKPPLHFWLIDLLTYPFGTYSMWPFVLPSIAGFLALLWLMWRMEGPVAAFVCSTSLMVWGSAQAARMDVTFTLTIAIAAWMMQRQKFVRAGLWLGIGTLIKGPMAPVIGLMLVLFEWLRTKQRLRGRYALAIVPMVVLPLLWFIPAMILGGRSYTREVLVKQTAGRAIGAWVHRSPFWYYIAHAPGDLFPWFLLAAIAIIAARRRGDDRAKFYVSWILAVLVPYSVMSSKLDVYMMAMIPPVALLIARMFAVDDVWLRRGWLANVVMMALLLLIGVAGLFVRQAAQAKPVLIVLIVTTVLALLVSRTPLSSTIALGCVTLVPLLYATMFLMPQINELGSDRPIVRAITAQHVPAERIALYSSPYLWTRDMPRELERVRFVSPESLRGQSPAVIVTSRKRANEIAETLRAYRTVDSFQLIGKWFDVYRR
ncbi:MAG TPA: glycosyltransferase family 39 protein [Thermoanaerobaculia bacterium]